MTSCAFTRGESNSGRESDFGTTPALGMGRGGLSPPKRMSCPPNQNVGKDSVTLRFVY